MASFKRLPSAAAILLAATLAAGPLSGQGRSPVAPRDNLRCRGEMTRHDGNSLLPVDAAGASACGERAVAVWAGASGLSFTALVLTRGVSLLHTR